METIHLLMCLTCAIASPIQIDTKQNMWVTWANTVNQTDFCLGLASANDPFKTCLIGFPYFDWNDWTDYTSVNETTAQRALPSNTCSRNFPSVQNTNRLAQVLGNLTVSATLPIQELDLLGSFSPYGPLVNLSTVPEYGCFDRWSLHAPNGTGAVLFNIRAEFDRLQRQHSGFYILKQTVGSSERGHWPNASLTFGTEEVTTPGGYRFPPGYFLICGDRAWPGLPTNPIGGPCYVGKLTMFTPTYRNLISNAYNPSSFSHRLKRALTIGPDCDSRVAISSVGEAAAMAIFTPGLLAAMNWKNIKNLACFAVQEFNITSNVIDALAHDVDSVCHAVLQNRAAVDFLLLTQGHGCTEFEGMCCFNLSDHSSSVH